MARYTCIDCGSRVAAKNITRCRTCYEIAHKAGLAGVAIAYNMRSIWQEGDGIRIRFYGDLTSGAFETLRETG